MNGNKGFLPLFIPSLPLFLPSLPRINIDFLTSINWLPDSKRNEDGSKSNYIRQPT